MISENLVQNIGVVVVINIENPIDEPVNKKYTISILTNLEK